MAAATVLQVRKQDAKHSQRTIPSGKVYRQLFDAEVQLVKSLDRSRSEVPRESRRQTCLGRPVVCSAIAEPGCGMLTDRQMTWVEEFPNESTTENPVLYKFYADESKLRIECERKENQPKTEVQGLPDTVEPAKVGSDIIDRVTTSRRLRHDAAWDNMHHELGLISTELEPHIECASKEFIQKLETNVTDITELLSKLDSDEAIVNYTMLELEGLWKTLTQYSHLRQTWIGELDKVLVALENERVSKMRGVFESTWTALEKIAYIAVPDLQRMLDRECQLINQMVLNNKRMYTDLKSKLLVADIDRDRKLYIHWKKRVDVWKQLHADHVIDEFKKFMASDEVVNNPGVIRILQEMTRQQHRLNQQRLETVSALNQVGPPALCSKFVADWYQKILDLSKSIDETNQKYFNELCLQYEAVCQACLGKVNELKKELIEKCICASEAEATELANKRCLPVVGEQQAKFEKTLESLDQAVETMAAQSLNRLKVLYKYCQAAAEVWDLHEVNLARHEQLLNEKLDKLRLQHDALSQEKEANLDVIMDLMRQESNEVALKEDLKKALQLLETMQTSYNEFFNQQSAVVIEYPEIIQMEVAAYFDTVCAHFNVKRTAEQPTLELGTIRTENGAMYVITELGQPLAEMSSTADAATPSNDIFLTEMSQDNYKSDSTVSAVVVEAASIVNVQNAIRLNFLNHLEFWSHEAVDRSRVLVDAKIGELRSELELRNHLHEPRARRAELDVHNVRSAELLMHAERVSRHITGVEQVLTELKEAMEAMTNIQAQRVERFQEDIVRLEKLFADATKTTRLTELTGQLTKMQTELSADIHLSVEQFREHLTHTAKTLRESTAQFLKSFKTFSDGGNFCPAEVTEYSKRLEKASQKIDSLEQSLLTELKSVEPRRADQSTKIIHDFEERFKNDMTDLTFVEKFARWLTNTQVKIKSEVADSNGQSSCITKSLAKLEQLIVACEQPGPDNGFGKPSDIIDHLTSLFELVHNRSVYLRCLKADAVADAVVPPVPVPPQPAAGLPPAASRQPPNPLRSSPTRTRTSSIPHLPGIKQSAGGGQAATVGFSSPVPPVPATSGVSLLDTIPPISKPGGKAPADDASVVTIRQILKSQKIRSVDGNPLVPSSSVQSIDSLVKITNMINESSKKGGKARDKSQASAQKRAQSGKSGNKNKIDPKNYVFGDGSDPDEQTHFTGRVVSIVRDTQTALFSAAEIFYKQKGQRPVTRPTLMQESLDQCTDTLTQKLQSYVAQTDSYYNSCIHEFRQQLVQLEELTHRVPRCVMQEILGASLDSIQKEQIQLEAEFTVQIDQLMNEKASNDRNLRPTLGHPAQLHLLAELTQMEEQRRVATINAIATHSYARQVAIVEHCRAFITLLSQSTEQLLLIFDKMLVVDDVTQDKIDPVKLPASELIRKKKAGSTLAAPEQDSQTKDHERRGPTTWPGLSVADLDLTLPDVPSAIRVASASKTRRVSSSSIVNVDGQRKQGSATSITSDSKKHGGSITSAASDSKKISTIFSVDTVDELKQLGSSSSSIPSESRVRGSLATAVSETGMKRDGSMDTVKSILKDSSSSAVDVATVASTPVTTAKATAGHHACVAARSEAYEEYKYYYVTARQTIEAERDEQMLEEQRWMQRWQTAVDKLKQLY